MRSLTLLLPLALVGCLREAVPPDPGECSKAPPDQNTWTWGEVLIGDCLSGPADMHFFERNGKTLLGVTNANPYLDFATGSLLVIDWDSIDLEIDRNLMHEVDAGAIPIDDYLGGFGVIDSKGIAMVSGRESALSGNRSGDDRMFLVDLSSPLHPRRHEAQPRIPMRDDPFPVVIDEANGRAYVGNITDHSVAVFDITGDELERIDVAPGTVVSVGTFEDTDGSGSTAVIDAVDVVFPEELTDDVWTVDWIDGTARVWQPSPGEELDTVGLQRFTDVGLGPVENAMGVELDPVDIGPFSDPYLFLLDASWMYFADADNGLISRVTNNGILGDWDNATLDGELFSGGPDAWDQRIAAPALTVVDATVWMIYEGWQDGGSHSLGLAVATGADNFPNAIEPFLVGDDNDGFTDFEDPAVWHDISYDGVRVWMTAVADDGSRSIGLVESDDDGQSWSGVELVLEEPGVDLSNPVVHRRHGRFELWYTRDDGAAWSHGHAWSWDGRTWFDAREYLTSDLPYDPLADDPRLAVQVDNTSAWRVEGRDAGFVDALISAGLTFLDAGNGFSLRVADGHEVDNDVVPDKRAQLALIPGSLVQIDGTPTLYVTQQDEGRSRLGILQQQGDSWVSVASDLIPNGEGGNIAGVSDPVVVAHGDVFTMFYAATNGQTITTIRRAASTDGINWSPLQGKALQHDDDWDGIEQRPHSIEAVGEDFRLWYTGSNGSRSRIGAATASAPRAALTLEPGEFDPWRFEPGVPGSFDDGGVRDPLVTTDDDGITHLIYAGFDGTIWSLGHAVLQEDGTFERRIDPVSDRSLPSMTGEPLSFSAGGAFSPVLLDRTGDELELLYAGTDNTTARLGRAVGRFDRQWPALRFPTVGDTLGFSTQIGRTGNSVIELEQETRDFISPGIGMSGMTYDAARGTLYIPSKLETYVYVVDVRDDSGGTLTDANALDLEGVVLVQNLGPLGFRDALIDNERDRLYLTSKNPDGVVIVDLTELVDDDTKEVTWHSAPAVLPLLDQVNDAGADTFASIGGAGMALTDDSRYLIVAHHKGNGVAIFDLEQGAWGAEVAWLSHVGENPHQVRMSPDGRYAVVANYVGEIQEDGSAASTLAVIDMDPTSDRFMEIVTRLANR